MPIDSTVKDDELRRLLKKKLATAARADREDLLKRVEDAARATETARREIEIKNRELQILIEQRDEFLSMAAHDLRSPLAVVQGYAELLADEIQGKVPPDDVALLDEIRQASKRMLGLLEGILDAASVAEGRVVVNPARFELDAFANELGRGYAMLARKKGLRFLLSAGKGWVTSDPLRLSQIIDNLVSNAIKFTPRGSGVDLSISAAKGEILIEVRDYGQGLAPQDLERLFRRFETGAAKGTDGEKSFGLGLAIVHSLTEALGGKVSVASEPGMGATFTVRIPEWRTKS
jgi:signal transduction histidine kinase